MHAEHKVSRFRFSSLSTTAILNLTKYKVYLLSI